MQTVNKSNINFIPAQYTGRLLVKKLVALHFEKTRIKKRERISQSSHYSNHKMRINGNFFWSPDCVKILSPLNSDLKIDLGLHFINYPLNYCVPLHLSI